MRGLTVALITPVVEQCMEVYVGDVLQCRRHGGVVHGDVCVWCGVVIGKVGG